MANKVGVRMNRGLFAELSIILGCVTTVSLLSSVADTNIAAAIAKPMSSPTLQEASGAEWVVEAQYSDFVKPLYEPADGKDGNNSPKIISFTRSTEFDYFEPPLAEFKVDQILKMPTKEAHARMHIGDTIRVPYHFHDLSACESPRNWKFSASLMPKKGTRWILFLNSSNPHFGQSVYETYRGDFGRWADTPENLSKVKQNLRSD
jgi:hypothetical protein